MSDSSAGKLTNERSVSPPSPTAKAQVRGDEEAPQKPDFYGASTLRSQLSPGSLRERVTTST